MGTAGRDPRAHGHLEVGQPRAKAAARALLQAAILIAVLVPLNVAGGVASRASHRQTLRNAVAVLQEVHSFKERRGRLPKSLDELQRSVDRPLPEPTYGGRFEIEEVEGGYVLTLRVPGQPEVTLFDSRRAAQAAEGERAGGVTEGTGTDDAGE